MQKSALYKNNSRLKKKKNVALFSEDTGKSLDRHDSKKNIEFQESFSCSLILMQYEV